MTTSIEQELLDQFTNVEDFEINDYVDQIISNLLVNNDNSSSLGKLNSLINILDSFTLQLSNQFTLKFNELMESNSIVSYSNEKEDEYDGITRLQFQTSTLKSSMTSLLEDVNSTSLELKNLTLNDDNNKIMANFQSLHEIKLKIIQILDVFNELKSIFGSSSSDIKSFTLDEFKIAINELKGLLLIQLDENPKNDKLLNIINGLIDLKPIFNNFVHFQPFYNGFITSLELKLESK